MIKKINAFIFDFDGVLADSNQIKRNAYFEIFGEPAREIINEVLEKNPDDNRYGIINKVLKRLKKERKIQYEDLELETEKYAQLYGERTEAGQIAAPAIQGAVKSLERLKKKGFRLFLHTSTTDESIARVLKARKLYKYFEKVYGSNKGKKAKVLPMIIKENSLSPERTISIGDGDSERKAAEKLGIKFIPIKR